MYKFRLFILERNNKIAVLADAKIREGVCCVVTSSVYEFTRIEGSFIPAMSILVA
jgi:hypothetical protein